MALSRTAITLMHDAAPLKAAVRPAQNIVSVGFELEGGLGQMGYADIKMYVGEHKLWDFFQDGRERRLGVPGCYHNNLELRLWNSDMQVEFDFLRYAYERCGFTTSLSCGFHVHMMFQDMPRAVSTFSIPEVIQEFVRQYTRAFPSQRYLDRLKNHWCAEGQFHEDWPQVHTGGRIAYCKNTLINIGAYTEKGTIEFRIMPNQLSGKEAVRSMQWIVDAADRLYSTYSHDLSNARVTPQQAQADAMHIPISLEPGQKSTVRKLYSMLARK